MSISKAHVKQIASKAKQQDIKPWIRRFCRLGYMAQGTVYTLIGILALMAALGVGGKATGTGGLLQSLAAIPFGEVLLWLIGIGLIGYITWQLIKAVKDPGNVGHDAKGILKRTGYTVSAIIYASISFTTLKVAMHSGHAGGGTERTISAKLLSYPLGQWLTGLIGVIIIGYGIYEVYKGYKEKFMNDFHITNMNDHEKRVARNSGKIGLIARGFLLSMVGFFFIRTAITSDPNQSKGLGGALSELAEQTYGQWLLGIAGAGLILYGIYGIIRGRYEKMSFG